MDRIVIMGLGLIGGSLGLAIKSAKLKDVEVIGFDISYDAVSAAKRMKAVDNTERDLEKALSTAAFVIVATPIGVMEEVFKEMAPFLAEGAIVTDTASTKGDVMRWAADYLPRYVSFIGGHPMAGREVGGIENASATLFQGATYCLVPSNNATHKGVELTVAMAKWIGADPYYIDAEEHDMLVAGISHLPLLLSAALVSTVSKSPSWDEMAKLASTGFRDTSRLASSDLAMSRGITATNRAGIVRWLDEYVEVLQEYRRKLDEAPEVLMEELERAQVARDKWVISKDVQASERQGEGSTAPGSMFAEFIGGSRLVELMKRTEDEEKKRNQRRPEG